MFLFGTGIDRWDIAEVVWNAETLCPLALHWLASGSGSVLGCNISSSMMDGWLLPAILAVPTPQKMHLLRGELPQNDHRICIKFDPLNMGTVEWRFKTRRRFSVPGSQHVLTWAWGWKGERPWSLWAAEVVYRNMYIYFLLNMPILFQMYIHRFTYVHIFFLYIFFENIYIDTFILYIDTCV